MRCSLPSVLSESLSLRARNEKRDSRCAQHEPRSFYTYPIVRANRVKVGVPNNVNELHEHTHSVPFLWRFRVALR